MSKRLITDHHHDPDAGHYRLEIAHVTEHLQSVLDENGDPVYLPDEPVLEDDGSPRLDQDGNPIVNPGLPMLEKAVQLEGTEDFLFAADDPKWKGKTPTQIAEEQRKLVKAALDERDKAAAKQQRSAAKRKDLPGVGNEI